MLYFAISHVQLSLSQVSVILSDVSLRTRDEEVVMVKGGWWLRQRAGKGPAHQHTGEFSLCSEVSERESVRFKVLHHELQLTGTQVCRSSQSHPRNSPPPD